ncbi:hypothetical protein [Azorhizobium caulinodans]|uniref:hypothetical protein n=1 Tax=Azorhizobium caulinodans TaxID=7 RepID=UPI000310C4AD|nr:hypothetical protein [Azorhizobium caulinodans]
MSQPALNRNGVPYHLPDFGPPARWLKLVFSDPADASDLPALGYYECDADDVCRRAIDIRADGGVRLAFPGGPDGDRLPKRPLHVPPEREGGDTLYGAISQQEFEALRRAFSRA